MSMIGFSGGGGGISQSYADAHYAPVGTTGMTKATGDGYWLDLNASNGPLTGNLVINGTLKANDGYFLDGTVSQPSVAFQSAPGSGMFRNGSGQTVLACNGVAGLSIGNGVLQSSLALQITSTGSFTGKVSMNDGYVADGLSNAPTLHFTSEPLNGLYRPGTNQLAATAGLTIAPYTTGQTPLIIRTANTTTGVNDRYVTIGSVGSEWFGVYTQSATGGVRTQITSSPLALSGSISTVAPAGATYMGQGTDRIKPTISYDGYSFHPIFSGPIAIKPKDEVKGTATLADDADLFVSVDALSRYNIEFDGYVQSTAGNGFNFSWAGTTSVSAFTAVTEIFGTQFSATSAFLSQSLGLAKKGSSSGAGFGQVIHTRGFLETGVSGGTFKLQWCNDSTASNLTMFKGARLKLIKV